VTNPTFEYDYKNKRVLPNLDNWINPVRVNYGMDSAKLSSLDIPTNPIYQFFDYLGFRRNDIRLHLGLCESF
jgi:hypothetical protein